jgi:hypothetical protein
MARVKVVAPDRILVPGKSNLDRCDNKVVSARYTALTFFPVVRVSLRSIRAVLLLLVFRTLLRQGCRLLGLLRSMELKKTRQRIGSNVFFGSRCSAHYKKDSVDSVECGSVPRLSHFVSLYILIHTSGPFFL